MKLRNFLAGVIILAGLGIFLWPTISALQTQRAAREAMEQVQQMAVTTAPTVATEAAAQTEPSNETTEPEMTEASTQSEMDMLYDTILAYNDRIYREGQASFQDPFSYEGAPLDLTQYGFASNVIGTIWIPRLEVELPLYLGATYDNLAQGAAVLGETSLPASSDNTNVAIAAHRGWNGAPMFRDIQLIQLDDKITITTPWEELVYRVCELQIITPEDTNAVLIQPGRNMITLITCHPYTQNYQRYLVKAELSVEEQPADKQEDLLEAEQTFDETPRQVMAPGENGETVQILVEPESITPVPEEAGNETGSDYSNRILWLEKVAPPGVLVLLGLLIVIKICTGRKERKG